MVGNKTKLGFADNGRRAGETHPLARHTDALVDEIRDRHAGRLEGQPREGYRQLAKRFGLSRTHVRDIVKFRRRYATPVDWRPEGAPKASAYRKVCDYEPGSAGPAVNQANAMGRARKAGGA